MVQACVRVYKCIIHVHISVSILVRQTQPPKNEMGGSDNSNGPIPFAENSGEPREFSNSVAKLNCPAPLQVTCSSTSSSQDICTHNL